MKVTYQINKPELTKAMNHHFNYRGKAGRIMWPIVACFMLYFGLSLVVSTGEYILGVTLTLLSLVFFFRKRVAIWKSVNRTFKDKPDSQEVTIEISEQKLSLTTTESQSQGSWSNFIDAHQVKDGLLLYTQKNLFNWIPESAVENGTWDEFCTMILDKTSSS